MRNRYASKKNSEHPYVTETKQLIEQRPRSMTYEIIAKECEVSLSWLRDLMSGNTKDPSANKVLVIRDFLSQSKAEG